MDEAVMEVIVQNVNNLDISKNDLKSLPKSISNSHKASKMWISDNPYQCNCDMIWMKDWLIDNNNVQDKDNVTCSARTQKGNQLFFLI